MNLPVVLNVKILPSPLNIFFPIILDYADLGLRFHGSLLLTARLGSRGLREVVPAQCHAPSLREFTVATGATAQTLQDIKLPDSAGL